MDPIPGRYAHVMAKDAPKMIREAMKLYGVKETPGDGNNPEIMKWAAEIEDALHMRRGALGYTADKIPWCGLGAGIVAVRAGKAAQMPRQPLWARNWAAFGQKADKPALGDVLVFEREGGFGHVGFYVAEGPGLFHVLGFNQGDKVSIVPIEKKRLITARRPRWRTAQPASVKPHWIEARGAVSRNEA